MVEKIPFEPPQVKQAPDFHFSDQKTAERVFADSEVKRALAHSILHNEESILEVRKKVEEVVRAEIGSHPPFPEEEVIELVNDRLLIYLNSEMARRHDESERHTLEALLDDAEKRASFDRFGFLRAEQYYKIGNQQMQSLLDSAQKNNQPPPRFTVVRADLINFKQVNDKHGHKIGDDYIKEAGEALNANIPFSKNNDYLLGHAGGDEFSLLLINFTDDEIREYLDSIRLAINDIGFSRYIEKKASDDETVSVGLVDWSPKVPLDLEQLDELADKQELANHRAYYTQPGRSRRSEPRPIQEESDPIRNTP